MCAKKNLDCLLVTNDDRASLINAFYDMGDLMQQRNWISRPRGSIDAKELPLAENLERCIIHYPSGNTRYVFVV